MILEEAQNTPTYDEVTPNSDRELIIDSYYKLINDKLEDTKDIKLTTNKTNLYADNNELFLAYMDAGAVMEHI